MPSAHSYLDSCLADGEWHAETDLLTALGILIEVKVLSLSTPLRKVLSTYARRRQLECRDASWGRCYRLPEKHSPRDVPLWVAIVNLMLDGEWRTARQIAAMVGGQIRPEAAYRQGVLDGKYGNLADAERPDSITLIERGRRVRVQQQCVLMGLEVCWERGANKYRLSRRVVVDK